MRHVVLIVGPPCAGKTTRAHDFPGYEIVDYDDIAQQLGSPNQHQHGPTYIAAANAEVERRITRIANDPDAHTVVIRSLPKQHERDALRSRLDADLEVIDPGQQVCLARAASRPSGTRRAIGLWYWQAGANHSKR